MKKLTILILFLTSSSVFASCPINEDATSCSLAQYQQQQPMQRTYSPQSTIKEFAGSPEARLKPSQNEEPSKNLRDFGPQPADYSYNTSCQFGVCNQSGAPQLFEQRGQ
ncbi:hypothetical protein IJ384_01790 [bacterium]|nr:hypothetical protein [bacterium]